MLIAQVIIANLVDLMAELSASMRYLSQRYTIAVYEVTGILTDIGTEELAHMGLFSAIIYQLQKRLY